MSYFVYDLRSQINSSLGTCPHTMAANEGVTEAVASFYRGDSDTVFLDFSYDLRPNIIPANFF